MSLTLRDRLERIRPAGSGPILLEDAAVAAFRRHFDGVHIGERLESPANDSDITADIVAGKKAALAGCRADELISTFEATRRALAATPAGTGVHANLERGLALIMTAAVEKGVRLAAATETTTDPPGSPDAATAENIPGRTSVRRRSPVVVARETLSRSVAGKYRNHASACREIEWRLEAGFDATLTDLKCNPSMFGNVAGNGPLIGPDVLDPHVEAAVSGLADALGRKKT